MDTCIIILEKVEGKELENLRNENIVKFVRVKKPIDIDELLKLIDVVSSDFEDERLKSIHKKQDQLNPKEKWGKYLRAPAVYFNLVNNPKITKLSDIAEIKRGFTTGANKFFYLNQEDIKLWQIERKYLKPTITSPKEVEHFQFNEDNISNYVLFVHEPKSALQGTNVLKYIEDGKK